MHEVVLFYSPRVITKQKSRIYVSLFACFWWWAIWIFCREFVNPGQKANALAASRHYCKLSRTTQLQDQTNFNKHTEPLLSISVNQNGENAPNTWTHLMVCVISCSFPVFSISTNVCVVRCGAIWSLQDYARSLRSCWLGALWPTHLLRQIFRWCAV